MIEQTTLLDNLTNGDKDREKRHNTRIMMTLNNI